MAFANLHQHKPCFCQLHLWHSRNRFVLQKKMPSDHSNTLYFLSTPSLRNDLYCVEWDVKPYYTIQFCPHALTDAYAVGYFWPAGEGDGYVRASGRKQCWWCMYIDSLDGKYTEHHINAGSFRVNSPNASSMTTLEVDEIFRKWSPNTYKRAYKIS